MDTETCWDHVVAGRLALAAILRGLAPAQWEHPSECAGWRVRDVAAHVISQPQLDWPTTLGTLRGAWRGFDAMTRRDGVRRGSASIDEILAQYDRWAGVRKGPALVTHVECLVDVLVHTQDIVRPLGLSHTMPPEAALVAADRARRLSALLHSGRIVRSVRMEAIDADWTRGSGPVLRGPIEELLLLCAGRPADRGRLFGPGLAILQQSSNCS